MAYKLLLLPTYFPTKQAPIVGAQIKEQAELIGDLYDIRVLYCLPGMGWKRFLFHIIFGKFIKNRGYKNCNEQILGGNLLSSGVYYFHSFKFSNILNEHLKLKAYEFAYKKLIEDGWVADLSLSRGFELGGSVAMNLKKIFGLDYVHTENTALLFDKNFSDFKLNLYKNVLIESAKTIYVSNFLFRNTVMHGFINGAYSNIIGNAVDESLFYPQKLNKVNDVYRILITGYNSYIKDYRTFFKAISYLKKIATPEFKCIIAMTYGNELNKQELLQLADKYNVSDKCEFHIEVSRENMPQLINSCDVYVSTSIIETFGIATLEALFCGKPVISTKNGGVEDFVTDENGILCQIGDFQCIGRGLAALITRDIVFDSDKIRESVLKNFGRDAYRRKMQNILNPVIGPS